jgi:hypothetical protein
MSQSQVPARKSLRPQPGTTLPKKINNYQFEKARKCRYNLAGRVVEFTNTKANGNRL